MSSNRPQIKNRCTHCRGHGIIKVLRSGRWYDMRCHFCKPPVNKAEIAQQYDLYGGTPPHVQRETSREAAETMKDRAVTLRRQVLEYIRSRGQAGATDEEIQDGLGISGSTQRPRRRELDLKGLIEPGGSRPTHSGRRATVWRAVS